MGHYDHEKAAKEDIINRPDVTGKDKKQAVKEPLKVSIADDKAVNVEPVSDELEQAAAKVISNTVDELKTLFGMSSNEEFKTLLSETLGGLFTALRSVSGRPWVRFAVAGGALSFAVIPPFLRYKAANSEKGEKHDG